MLASRRRSHTWQFAATCAALLVLTGTGAFGCTVHRSTTGWHLDPVPAATGPTLLVLEPTSPSGRSARAVAARVQDLVTSERAAGRAAFIVSPGAQTQAVVMRIDLRGGAKVVSHCATAAGTCQIEPPDRSRDAVDLVYLGSRPHPDPRDATPALLGALGPPGPGTIPRLLVIPSAVESASPHGLGGGPSDATFHHLPAGLREHVVAGTFAGVLSTHDRVLQVIPDLDDAVRRADKVWLRYPTFQVISATATGRRPRAGARYFDGISAVPAVVSAAPGFVAVQLAGDHADLIVHAWRHAWVHSRLRVPLFPAPKPRERTAPPMTPCLRCGPVPADDHP